MRGRLLAPNGRPMAEYAAWYSAMGLALVPIAHGTKVPPKGAKGWQTTPVRDPAEAGELWSEAGPYHGMGIGCVHGPSNTFALDIDDVVAARTAFAAVGIDLDEMLAAGVQSRSPRPGSRKVWFRRPPGVAAVVRSVSWRVDGKLKKIIEFRGGGQDVLPPSAYPGGGSYVWVDGRMPDGFPPMPAELVALLADATLLDAMGRADPNLLAESALGDAADAALPRTTGPGGTGILRGGWEDVRAEIRRRITPAEVLARHGVVLSREHKAICPFHPGEQHASFWLFTGADGIGRWTCGHGGLRHGLVNAHGGTTGDVIDLYANLNGCTIPQATAALARELGIELPEREPRRNGTHAPPPQIPAPPGPVADPADAEPNAAASDAEHVAAYAAMATAARARGLNAADTVAWARSRGASYAAVPETGTPKAYFDALAVDALERLAEALAELPTGAAAAHEVTCGPTPVPTDVAQDSAPNSIVWHWASQIVEAIIAWVWPGWIPRRSLTLITGESGAGKTMLWCDIVARITRGDCWPDSAERGTPQNVLVWSTEDDAASVLVPRLRAAGADMDRVAIVTVSGPIDVADLARLVAEHEIGLVAFDPLTDAAGVRDSNAESDIRPKVLPLVALAQSADISVLGVRHTKKGSAASGAARVMGNVAWVALARAVIQVDKLPDRTLLVSQTKGNLGPPPAPLSAEIDGGEGVAPSIRWIGSAEMSPGEILEITSGRAAEAPPPRASGETVARVARPSAVNDAMRLYSEVLADGGWHLRSEVLAAAPNVSAASERRARERLHIETRQQPAEDGRRGPSEWRLTASPPGRTPESCTDGEDEPCGAVLTASAPNPGTPTPRGVGEHEPGERAVDIQHDGGARSGSENSDFVEADL